MNWYLLELWFHRSLLVTSVITLVVFATSSCRDFGKYGQVLGERADNAAAGRFPPSIPAVQAVNAEESKPELNSEGLMPDLRRGGAWLNSAIPLGPKSLRGKVVLVNFWTYTCINSLRTLPYVKEWSEKYKDLGLVVIGVHTPEFSFEREQPNVEAAIRAHELLFPIVMDNHHEIWRAFNNQYWPAFYLIDSRGQIRYHHFGEGNYVEMEHAIQVVLKENGSRDAALPINNIVGNGIEAPPSADERSPESYLGSRLSQRFASPGGLKENQEKIYSAPQKLAINHWGLIGPWKVNGESAALIAAPGKIIFRFHSRDLNLVMAPAVDGTPIRFKVTLDGAVPGDDCGVDAASDGTGTIRASRLYQLIRQKRQVQDSIFEIEFLDPGVQALDFTFG